LIYRRKVMGENMRETVLVIDFGGQYNQLIARRVREQNVYCEILPYSVSLEKILSYEPKGLIFTGGPKSVYSDNAPRCDEKIFEAGIPILGICYGGQLMSIMLGGNVARAMQREYGKADITYDTDCPLFTGMPDISVCWMSHGDYVDRLPMGFDIIARTNNSPYAAFGSSDRKLYGVQFHPEVMHTKNGTQILKNFLYEICGCIGGWTMHDFAKSTISALRHKIGDQRVLLALSGGVDSSVCAVLLNEAVGSQLTCIFVDHGLLRKGEADEVERVFKGEYDINLIRVNAQQQFLEKLEGVTDPEEKRKIIGAEFIRVFEEEAKKIGGTDFLAQGTIYPDVIESGLGPAAVIKSHHNVGGLPVHVDFKEIVEPLRELFKDEVRKLGEELDMPHHMIYRQPFPGPGLAIRIIGDVTQEKLAILRQADYIFRDEIAKAGLDSEIWQYFAVLTGMKSVGVMGDERTYDYTVALRAVTSVDGMTADWARIPYDVMEKISNRIINEAGHINRVVYDITSKPPATIEWE
jgi:GMP synthase (glutamine-hydrolysing)